MNPDFNDIKNICAYVKELEPNKKWEKMPAEKCKKRIDGCEKSYFCQRVCKKISGGHSLLFISWWGRMLRQCLKISWFVWLLLFFNKLYHGVNETVFTGVRRSDLELDLWSRLHHSADPTPESLPRLILSSLMLMKHTFIFTVHYRNEEKLCLTKICPHPVMKHDFRGCWSGVCSSAVRLISLKSQMMELQLEGRE